MGSSSGSEEIQVVNRKLLRLRRISGTINSFRGMILRPHRSHFLSLLALLTLAAFGFAQEATSALPGVFSSFDSGGDVPRLPSLDATLLPHPPMPLMSPEVALRSFQER